MRALIMAGGSGGHIFPALAVARQLEAAGWQVEWLGSATRMEATIVPKAGIKLHSLAVRGLRGGGLKGKLGAPFMLLRAIWQALAVVRTVQPDVVVGFGGFASGPGGLAAKLARKPLVIHEQNAVAGMTNRYLAKLANTVLQAFPGALDNARVVGNPVRAEIVNLPAPAERFANRTGALRIQVLGGSQGARALNEKLPACLAAVFADTPVDVYHQCGRGSLKTTHDAYTKAGLRSQVSEFVEDMPTAYGAADLVICRAGALTVCELAAAGVAAIFVPFPAAVDDHQTYNAEFLVKAGAARLLQQSDLNVATLTQQLSGMRDRQELLAMATAARGQAVMDSAEQVASVCQELV